MMDQNFVEIKWIWILLAGVWGILFILRGVEYLNVRPPTEFEEAKHSIGPVSKERIGWKLLMLGLTLSLGAFAAFVIKLRG